jgi:hypothetical protein
MSIRREGDQVRTIGTFDNWLEQSIREAQLRGEFDNLQGQGKPQDLASDPNAGDWESGFRILKNNGLAPAWIEADKEIRAEQAALTDLAERTARFIAEHHEAALAAPVERDPSPTTWRTRLGRLWNGSATSRDEDGPLTLDMLRYERDRARREYLQRSDALNETIEGYNSALPFDLLWRERRKISPEQAAEAFDRICPPVAV